jgi:hypothetical protein
MYKEDGPQSVTKKERESLCENLLYARVGPVTLHGDLSFSQEILRGETLKPLY